MVSRLRGLIKKYWFLGILILGAVVIVMTIVIRGGDMPTPSESASVTTTQEVGGAAVEPTIVPVTAATPADADRMLEGTPAITPVFDKLVRKQSSIKKGPEAIKPSIPSEIRVPFFYYMGQISSKVDTTEVEIRIAGGDVNCPKKAVRHSETDEYACYSNQEQATAWLKSLGVPSPLFDTQAFQVFLNETRSIKSVEKASKEVGFLFAFQVKSNASFSIYDQYLLEITAGEDSPDCPKDKFPRGETFICPVYDGKEMQDFLSTWTAPEDTEKNQWYGVFESQVREYTGTWPPPTQ